jgi:hypothetical protein
MKIIAVCLLALSLTACAGIPSPIVNPVTTTSLYDVEAVYGTTLVGAVAYRNLPLCKKSNPFSASNICAYRSIIVKMQAADRKAQIAIVAGRKFITQNPTIDATSVINIAANAVATFQSIVNENRVN